MKSSLIKKTAFLGILVFSINLYAAAPFRNGDFEKGKGRWKGDGKIVKEEGSENKVLKFEAGKKEQVMELEFDVPRGAKRANVEYQVKGKSFKPKEEGERGFTLVWVNKGIYISGHRSAEEGEWITIKSTFKIKPGSKFVGARFKVDPGSGVIYFDNLTVKFE